MRGAGDSTALPVLREIELVIDVFRLLPNFSRRKAEDMVGQQRLIVSLGAPDVLGATKIMSSTLLSWVHVQVESWALSVWAAVNDQSCGMRVLC